MAISARRWARSLLQKTFAPSTKQGALKMTKEIESAMESEIKQLPWMGDETKQRALEKLHGDRQ